MNLQLYAYLGSALAGLVFHWIMKGKDEPSRPSGVNWILHNYGYAMSSLALTLGSALFFMPDMMGMNANIAGLAMGIAGGSTIKNLFTK